MGAGRVAVEAVVFDTADVLFDATHWPRQLVGLVQRFGVSVGFEAFTGRWEQDFLAEVCRGRRAYDEAFQSFLLTWGLSWAQIDEIEADGRIVRHRGQRETRPLPGVATTLQALAERGFRLAAWADAWESAAAVAVHLRRLGLPGVFSEVLCSCDLEATQPDAECYGACLAAVGTAAQRTAYVGHDAAHLAAARSAGLVTVAFNHHPSAAADFHLAQFDGLLSLLALPAPG